MTYDEALAFIRETSWLGCRPGLERISELMELLGNPQKKLRFIHITGTNGKGSTAAMLASILTQAGYRTGLFTSPHLCRYNERIKIDGTDISDGDLCAAAEETQAAAARMHAVPSEFERFTAMAFLHFLHQACDIVVLEVGLGGALDSTNVIDPPEIAVITNIGLDHTEYLGRTLAEIAAAKAGIIKPGSDVVLYGQSSVAEQVVRERCALFGSTLTVTALPQVASSDLTGQVLSYRKREALRLRLPGTHQAYNAALALDAVDLLIRRGWHIPESAVYGGLAGTVWPGRFQVLRPSPPVLLDGAHNADGAEALAECLRTCLPGEKLTLVMGVMADKDYETILTRMAPFAERLIAVAPDCPRALPAGKLAAAARDHLNVPVVEGGSVRSGLSAALSQTAGGICIFGSLYQVGEVLDFFREFPI